MACAIKDALSSTDINLVIASEIGTAAYFRYFMSVPALFEEIELGVLYDKPGMQKHRGIVCATG
jgi:hypothetical protein